MAVYLSEKPDTNLKIQVEEEDGKVCLKYNDHAFVVCETDCYGNHTVKVIDVDTGITHESNIRYLCMHYASREH